MSRIFSIVSRLCTSVLSAPGGQRQLHVSCQRQGTLLYERHWIVPLPKLGRPAKLKRRHNIYKVSGKALGQKEVDVILTKDSLEFGVAGEVLTLERKTARTLIRNFEAVYASPENLSEYQSNLVSKSTQTTSGRRLLLWLKSIDSLKCPMRQGVKWTLTPEAVSRALHRAHGLVVPASALTMPEDPISEHDDGAWGQHNIKITVNEVDTVTLPMEVIPWNPDGQRA